MTNQNLFKEAIADAKTVREIALQNAKVALEETLTPRLQSMLSTKLQEMEKEEEDLNENSSEENLEEDFDISSILAELDETDDEVVEEKKDEDKDEEETEETEEAEDETAEEVAAETETEEAEVLVKDMTADDLKAMIQDIVAQEMGAGAGGDEMDLGAEEMPDLGAEETADLGVAAEEDNDEIDLEELLAELDALDETEDKDADDLDEAKKKDKEVKTEAKKDKKELEEAIKVINTLRNELHEQNLLNAKLLYVNKIFKAKNLTESQKLKVISSFDKATTVKEAKIVFESLNTALTSPKKQIKESLGFASKAAGNAPKTNIIETDAVVTRWQKLANIK